MKVKTKVHDFYLFTFADESNILKAITALFNSKKDFWYRAERKEIGISGLKTEKEVNKILNLLKPYDYTLRVDDLPF